jgi:hypothetical protein
VTPHSTTGMYEILGQTQVNFHQTTRRHTHPKTHYYSKSPPSRPPSHRSRAALKIYGEGGGMAPRNLTLGIRKEMVSFMSQLSHPRGEKRQVPNKQWGWGNPGASLGLVHTRSGHDGSGCTFRIHSPRCLSNRRRSGLRSGMVIQERKKK